MQPTASYPGCSVNAIRPSRLVRRDYFTCKLSQQPALIDLKGRSYTGRYVMEKGTFELRHQFYIEISIATFELSSYHVLRECA